MRAARPLEKVCSTAHSSQFSAQQRSTQSRSKVCPSPLMPGSQGRMRQRGNPALSNTRALDIDLADSIAQDDRPMYARKATGTMAMNQPKCQDPLRRGGAWLRVGTNKTIIRDRVCLCTRTQRCSGWSRRKRTKRCRPFQSAQNNIHPVIRTEQMLVSRPLTVMATGPR